MINYWRFSQKKRPLSSVIYIPITAIIFYLLFTFKLNFILPPISLLPDLFLFKIIHGIEIEGVDFTASEVLPKIKVSMVS